MSKQARAAADRVRPTLAQRRKSTVMGTPVGDNADSGWDDYAERILRNEGRLQGLEALVSETRESDRKLVHQRSESLDRELERRADALLVLSKEERESDRREVELWQRKHEDIAQVMRDDLQHQSEISLNLLREVYDTAIREAAARNTEAIKQNYEQSREAIRALEQRGTAANEKMDQMVRQWRDSDREARVLFATETARHLDQLNHNNERMAAFQANSVTRELWQSEKEATATREAVLRDQVIALDRVLLTMQPMAVADKSHSEMMTRIEAYIKSQAEVLDQKITTANEKITKVEKYQDTASGRSSGYSALYGWAVAAIGLMVAIIVGANALFGK